MKKHSNVHLLLVAAAWLCSPVVLSQSSTDARYTKVSNTGFTLTAGVPLGAGSAEWACTQDESTGLLWEVKTDDPTHLRYMGHRYTWFDAASETGSRGNPLTCGNSLGSQPCNTAAYIAAVNAARLCGHSDWRMPSLRELQSILDPMESAPAMNPEYFPNTLSTFFWTGTPYPDSSSQSWHVHVGTAFSYGNASRSSNRNVRLVRGGR
ncbi:MAG: DUF1566 domain-containing protein [Natronospirillum sp.]